MGNSKSKKKKNNSKTSQEVEDMIRNYFSENKSISIDDNFTSNNKINDEIVQKMEKSNIIKITEGHEIVELSLNLISKHTNVEISKKTNQILYTSLMYPPIYDGDEKAPPIISIKTSNYMFAQRGFDKIRDVLVINEDGEYVATKDKQSKLRYSTTSQASSNQQKGFGNQSFLSFFHNNLNVSNSSYNANNTDNEKISVRNYKKSSSIKSTNLIFDEKSRKKSTKSLRNILVTDASQKRKSLIKIKETQTERNSFESQNDLIEQLSPKKKEENMDEKKKPKSWENIRRLKYGYGIQKNLLNKFKKIHSDNEDGSNRILSDLENSKDLENYKSECHLDIHTKVGKPNYSWLKNILNLGIKKNTRNSKNKIEFKVNMKEIVKQTLKDEPFQKKRENAKKSISKPKNEKDPKLNNVSDTSLFNKFVEKYIGLENTYKPKKDKKYLSQRIVKGSLKYLQLNKPDTNDTLQNIQIPYSEEMKNQSEEVSSEYETPDEDNSYQQINRIKSNYMNDYQQEQNSSFISDSFDENVGDMYADDSLKNIHNRDYNT